MLGVTPGAAWSAAPEIGRLLPATIALAFFGFVASVTLGAIVGGVRARARAPVVRSVLALPPLVGRAIPVALLALVLQLILAFTTKLPTGGIASGDAFDVRDRLAHIVEPVLTLALPFGAWASLIFYDVFRAPGPAARTSFRQIAGVVAMTAALLGPALLSATVLVEPRFAWPGVSRLFYNRVSQLDAVTIAGVLVAYSVGVVLIKLCGELTGESEAISPAPARRLSAAGVTGLVVLAIAGLAAVTANLVAPDPYFIDVDHWSGYPLAPGVAGHLLGTEENGRDLLGRLLVGMQTSLGIAALAAIVACAIGALVAWATRRVQWLDERGALVVVGIRPFAGLPFILAAITALVGRLHTFAVLHPIALALMIGAVSWPAIVPAFRRLAPATVGAVADLVGCALLLEVTMSMHGFGVQPVRPSLGNLLVNAQDVVFMAPWAVFIPFGVIVVVLMALYAVGDDLREPGIGSMRKISAKRVSS